MMSAAVKPLFTISAHDNAVIGVMEQAAAQSDRLLGRAIVFTG